MCIPQCHAETTTYLLLFVIMNCRDGSNFSLGHSVPVLKLFITVLYQGGGTYPKMHPFASNYLVFLAPRWYE